MLTYVDNRTRRSSGLQAACTLGAIQGSCDIKCAIKHPFNKSRREACIVDCLESQWQSESSGGSSSNGGGFSLPSINLPQINLPGSGVPQPQQQGGVPSWLIPAAIGLVVLSRFKK